MRSTSNSVDYLLSVVANRTRKTILETLSESPCSFTELMQECGMEAASQCGVFSFHLRKLLTMNLVDQVDGVYFITYFGRKVASLLENLEREAKTVFSYPKIWMEVIRSKMRIYKIFSSEKEKYGELLLKIFGRQREELVNSLTLKGNHIIVAEDEDEGFIGFLHFHTLKEREGHIWDTAVVENHRNEGVEDALVEQSLELMKSLNYISSTAYVIPYTNEEKLDFWKSKGFNEVSYSFAFCNGINLLDKAAQLYAFMKGEDALSEPEVWFWMQRQPNKTETRVTQVMLRRLRENDLDDVELGFKTKIPEPMSQWLEFSYVAIKKGEVIGYCLARQDQGNFVVIMLPQVSPSYQDLAQEVKLRLVDSVMKAAKSKGKNLGCRIIKYSLIEDFSTPELKEWLNLGFQPTRILFNVEATKTDGFYNAFKRSLQQASTLDLNPCPDYQIDFALERGIT